MHLLVSKAAAERESVREACALARRLVAAFGGEANSAAGEMSFGEPLSRSSATGTS